eukprot:447146_1
MYSDGAHQTNNSDDWYSDEYDTYRAEHIAIGIRLGQRWCSVSCIEDGKVRDLIGKIPSLVTFTPNKTYYGTEAIRHSITNINNSIYQFFGLLGRKYNSKPVQQLIKHITYDIIQIDPSKHHQIPQYELVDEDIGIPIRFTSHSQPHIYSVIEIVSQFLEHIMRETEDRLGCAINHVAISVPNTFGQLQRLALLQAAKEVNIEPLRLVTSCLAASVCLRYHQIQQIHGTSSETTDEDDSKGEDIHAQDAYDYNNRPYTNESIKNGYYSNNKKNGYGSHYSGEKTAAKKKKKNRTTQNKCYLIADLSNIACSVSVIECVEKRHSEIVKVYHLLGTINYGIWRMINSFSLFVVKSFVDGYRGYYRPTMNMIEDKGAKRYVKSKYNYRNDVFVYKQLQQIEEIEMEEENSSDDDDEEEEDWTNTVNKNEALKCRFRSQMLCDTIIEHLHDQYKNEEVQIQYDKFYRSFSLQLILTSRTLHEIALNPFLFNMINCIDKILQEAKSNNKCKKIDECVLVGDGGNIPQVVALFGEYFNVNAELSSHHIVARGCAIVSAVDQELISTPISLDVLPQSIRMYDATNGKHNTLIIEAQNPCPCKKTVTRYTSKNNQSTYDMKFYEGESTNNKSCALIGVFQIINIPKRPKRETKIVIAVHLDRNCIMMVSAEDVTSKPPMQLTVIKLPNH